MRLVLCDDNKILCDALGVALSHRGHWVVATANTTAAGIAAVAAFQPSVCLLDLRFPDPPDGLEAAWVMRQQCPGTAVLILSGFIDQAVRAQAARIGVAGFLRKDQNVDHVANALNVIAAGGEIFDSVRAGREPVCDRGQGYRGQGDRGQGYRDQGDRGQGYRSQGDRGQGDRGDRGDRGHRGQGCGSPVLTPREREVLFRMAAGQSTAQMACEMDVEVSTVRTYVKYVLIKLGAHSRLQAVAVATRDQLLGDGGSLI